MLLRCVIVLGQYHIISFHTAIKTFLLSCCRIFWAIIVLSGMLLCGSLIYPVYNKWQTVPTITSVATTNHPIWSIYFPAVTICSNNKVVASQFRAILKRQPWKNLSTESGDSDLFEKDLKTAVRTVALFNEEPEILEDDELTIGAKKILDEYKGKLPGLLQSVMQTCSMMLMTCIWQGKTVPCSELFSVRRTDNGYCCSFNTLRMSEQL
jgi:amiloride-sensitive sodium channel